MRELSLTTSKYGNCLRELSANMATLPKEEYDNVLRQCDEPREVSERARLALHWHMIEHGC
jgi:hypothetical protein